jgi:hypothetical protein
MVNTASDVKLNALSNALSFDPFAPLLSSEIALKVCPDFYCSPVILHSKELVYVRRSSFVC